MKLIKNFFSKIKNLFKKPAGLFKRSIITSNTFIGKKTSSLLESFKSAEVRNKILLTLGLLVVYRILAAVPLPGIDIKLFNEAFGENPINNLFTLVTGGRLDNPSVVAIGLGAYINASIIIQLLSTVIPKLEELSKEGERGQQILNQYTRVITVPLAIVQAIVIWVILKNVASSVPELQTIVDKVSTFDLVTMIITLTAGQIILMWIGELISEYGVGNGISILIASGILASLPTLVSRDFQFIANDFSLLSHGNFNVLLNENFRLFYMVLIGVFLLVFGIVFITEAVRKIPIQYARRVRGAQGAASSFLPLKINQAGVMPVIFASALLTFPQIIAQLVMNTSNTQSILYKIGNIINSSFLVNNSLTQDKENFYYYQISYFILIIAFTFFYTFVTYKPSQTAENLQKSGGFIPGRRPGKATEQFIAGVLARLTLIGSIFLGVVALLPNIVRLSEQGQNLTILSGIGGTSILIIIGVILDTIRKLKSLTVSKSYDQYK